jgi:hypothetical protein
VGESATIFKQAVATAITASNQPDAELLVKLKLHRWDPKKHPRDGHGRFISLGELVDTKDGRGQVIGFNKKTNKLQVQLLSGKSINHVKEYDSEKVAMASVNRQEGRKSPHQRFERRFVQASLVITMLAAGLAPQEFNEYYAANGGALTHEEHQDAVRDSGQKRNPFADEQADQEALGYAFTHAIQEAPPYTSPESYTLSVALDKGRQKDTAPPRLVAKLTNMHDLLQYNQAVARGEKVGLPPTTRARAAREAGPSPDAPDLTPGADVLYGGQHHYVVGPSNDPNGTIISDGQNEFEVPTSELKNPKALQPHTISLAPSGTTAGDVAPTPTDLMGDLTHGGLAPNAPQVGQRHGNLRQFGGPVADVGLTPQQRAIIDQLRGTGARQTVLGDEAAVGDAVSTHDGFTGTVVTTTNDTVTIAGPMGIREVPRSLISDLTPDERRHILL